MKMEAVHSAETSVTIYRLHTVVSQKTVLIWAFLTGCLFGLSFDPEDGGNIFFVANVYQTTRCHSPEDSTLYELQMLETN
jgi:hypothetical protein